MTRLVLKICFSAFTLNLFVLLRAYSSYSLEKLNIISEMNFENKFQYIKIFDYSYSSNTSSFQIINDPYDSINHSVSNSTNEMIIKPNEMTLLDSNNLLCDDYSSSFMNFRTCKMKILNFLDLANKLNFNLIKASWKLNNITNFLNFIDFKISPNKFNFFEVYPMNLQTKFSFSECYNNLCDNLTNISDDGFELNEYNFKIIIDEDLLLYYELILSQAIIIVKDSLTLKENFLYIGEVSDYLKLDSRNISTLIMDNLPEEFELQLSYKIKKLSDSNIYNRANPYVKYFFIF